TGTWNEMEFTPMNFQADPLARLDVIFSTNVLESMEANNEKNDVGTSPGNAGTAQAGAYYNDADGVFKSRLNNIMTVPGPFSPVEVTRIRNATRFASRYLSGPFILQPDRVISPDNGIFA